MRVYGLSTPFARVMVLIPKGLYVTETPKEVEELTSTLTGKLIAFT